MNHNNRILGEQIKYYKARANEYDEWFLRKGRYDLGLRKNKEWFSEVEEIKKTLAHFHPKGNVLEFAAGTGWWTQELIRYADHVTAVDSSSEVIRINQAKSNTKKVTYIQSDIFKFNHRNQFDVIFFSFWLSHVPKEKFEQFWNLVKKSLKPHGRIFFIDSLKSEVKEKTFTINNPERNTSLRKLNNGKTFQIIKVFYDPKELENQLDKLGWKITVQTTKNHFLYGFGGIKTKTNNLICQIQ